MKITESIYLVGSLQLGISGSWDCHVYLVKGSDGLILIDAGGGTDTDKIFENIKKEGFDPADIKTLLLTHNHFDHSCGAAEIKELTGCKVYLSKLSKVILENATEQEAGLELAKAQGIYPPEFRYRNCKVDFGVTDGDVFTASGVEFKAINVAGHSSDSICYLAELDGKQVMFAGDVVFYGGVIGLINAPDSSMDGYRRDINKLSSLNIDGLYPGHYLFTVNGGQQHIDAAIEACSKGSVPTTLGQLGPVF